MKRKGLYLPYAAWPEDDRTRWEAAFKAGTDLFDDCGLESISRNGRVNRYNMLTENFSPSFPRMTTACSPALPPNGSTADHRGIRQVATEVLRRCNARQLPKPPPTGTSVHLPK